MTTIRRAWLASAGAVLLLATGAAAQPAHDHPHPAPPAKPLAAGIMTPRPTDMSLGSPTAKVRLIEYASASCGHCATWAKEVFPAFKRKYIDTGRVRYTLREMLTSPAEVSAAGFALARCAGPGKYFTVVDAVFHGQEEMFADGTTRGVGPVLERIGAANGVSGARYQACMADEAAFKAIEGRAIQASRDGLSRTPTFIVDGVKVAEGEAPLATLDAAIAKAEARAAARR